MNRRAQYSPQLRHEQQLFLQANPDGPIAKKGVGFLRQRHIRNLFVAANVQRPDDDRLSAHVAVRVRASRLVIRSIVDGLLDTSNGGRVIPVVRRIDDRLRALASGTQSELSVGGMTTKLLAAEIAADPNLLDGSALTSLGSLYYQVPGWPIGFGNDKKAREYLERGLQVAPEVSVRVQRQAIAAVLPKGTLKSDK